MRAAGVLERVAVAQFRWPPGRGAVLFDQDVEHLAADGSALLRREDSSRRRTSNLEPGFQRAGLLTVQVVLTGVGALQPVHHEPVGPRLIVAHLDQPDLTGSQPGVVHEPEDGTIPSRIDGFEKPSHLFFLWDCRHGLLLFPCRDWAFWQRIGRDVWCDGGRYWRIRFVV